MANTRASAGYSCCCHTCCCFFYTQYFCRSDVEARQLMLAPLFACFVICSYALLQVAGWDVFDWVKMSVFGGYVRPIATLGHANFLGAYLVVVFPLVGFYAAEALQKGIRWVAFMLGVLAIAIGCVLIAALSRAAWLAFAVACLILVAGSCYLAAPKRVIQLTIGFVCCVVLIGIVLVCSDSRLAASLTERVERLGEASSRWHLWQCAWAMFCDHPILGQGVDTFHVNFGRYRSVEYACSEWGTTPLRAHNELLHVLATQGLFGAGAVLLIGSGWLWHAWLRWHTSDRGGRLWLVALLAGMAGFVVQSCAGFTSVGLGTIVVTLAALVRIEPRNAPGKPNSVRLPAVVGFVFAIAVFLVNVSYASRRSAFLLVGILIVAGLMAALVVITLDVGGRTAKFNATVTPRAMGVGLAICLILGAGGYVLVVRPLQADVACRHGQELLANDPEKALRYLQQATAMEPTNPFYWGRLGLAVQRLVRQPLPPRKRHHYLQIGEHAYHQAIRHCPSQAYYFAGLGRIRTELVRMRAADKGAAFAAYDQALRLDPKNGEIAVDAANGALTMGDWERARAYADSGLRSYPRFGPLKAHVGYAAFMQKRYREAVDCLTHALVACEWRGEKTARDFAFAMLSKAQNLYAMHQQRNAASRLATSDRR
ncbi:MAG: hypothetical protein KatS3mg105_4154 [Gemmatales bacterium]|nr:MAG: hypothetical protein KatS3mg105_4154 [Gemmatales bacterium]